MVNLTSGNRITTWAEGTSTRRPNHISHLPTFHSVAPVKSAQKYVSGSGLCSVSKTNKHATKCLHPVNPCRLTSPHLLLPAGFYSEDTRSSSRVRGMPSWGFQLPSAIWGRTEKLPNSSVWFPGDPFNPLSAWELWITLQSLHFCPSMYIR